MDNQTRIKLIKSMVETYELYSEYSPIARQEQVLAGVLEDEISKLMTESEFALWVDCGEFKPETNKMKLTFNTNRPYSIEGQIIHAEVFNTYVDEDNFTILEVHFYDTTRNIGGVMEFDTDIENFNEKNIMLKYDHNCFDETKASQAKHFFNL